MDIRVTERNKGGMTAIATGAASTLLLYTAFALTSQREPFNINSVLGGGRMPVITVSTADVKGPEYVVDANTQNFAKFQFLAEQWKKERGAQPTAAAMATLPSYQKIIGMGKDALAFILKELKVEGDAPDHWFWALAAISDENPVPPENRGKLSEMAKAWLDWGQKEGHVG